MSHRCGTFARREHSGGERFPGLRWRGARPVAAQPGRNHQRVPVRGRDPALRRGPAAAARGQRLGQVDGDEHAAAVPVDRTSRSHRRRRRAERDTQVVDAQRTRRPPAGGLPVDRVRTERRVRRVRLRDQGQPPVRQRDDLVVRHLEAPRHRLPPRHSEGSDVGRGASRRARRRRGVRRPPPRRVPAGRPAAALRRGADRPAHRADPRRPQPARRRPDRCRPPGAPGRSAAAAVRAGADGGRPAARRP